jgi:hypothetical protein
MTNTNQKPIQHLTVDRLLKGLYAVFPEAAKACDSINGELQWWLEWPPDVFALTSLVLSQTGAYRWQVSPPKHVSIAAYAQPSEPQDAYPEDALLYFNSTFSHIRSGWLGLLTGEFRPPSHAHPNGETEPNEPTIQHDFFEHGYTTEQLREFYRSLSAGHQPQASNKVELEEITGLHEICWRLERLLTDLRSDNLCDSSNVAAISNVLWLHAAADEACQPIGILAGGFGRETMAYVMAHLMLEQNGSLARWPRTEGAVMPKMRTTQRGLTLRSASHNLSFHRTEVKVAWRSFPWLSNTENQINTLLIPWPFEVRARQFQALPISPEQNANLGQPDPKYGFFGFRCDDPTPQETQTQISTLLETVEQLYHRSHQEVERVHAIVFPELSLTRLEFAAILERLQSLSSSSEDGQHSQIPPVVIAGIRHHETDRTKSTAINQMAVAAYFWERWYIYTQDKHHRWLLDPSQLQQYRLDTQLKDKLGWWEGIEIHERKLTFFNPNRWLTLCPLICEDLAQIDPVSELIRGIGPTFLVALLMDGPQLQQRWPARYASVFANDPGSSVLTLTSLGMATRSRLVHEEPNRTIASWSQLNKPPTQIKFDIPERAALLSIVGRYSEELALDGRSDGKSASYLEYKTVHHFELDSNRKIKTAAKAHSLEKLGQLWDNSQAGEDSDLTLLAFTVDACLEAPDYVLHDIKKLVGIEPEMAEGYIARGPKSVTDWLTGKVTVEDPWTERFKAFSAFMLEYRKAHWITWGNELHSRFEDWQGLRKAIQAVAKKTPRDTENPKEYVLALILWALHNRVIQFLNGPQAPQVNEQLSQEMLDVLRKDLKAFADDVSNDFMHRTQAPENLKTQRKPSSARTM